MIMYLEDIITKPTLTFCNTFVLKATESVGNSPYKPITSDIFEVSAAGCFILHPTPPFYTGTGKAYKFFVCLPPHKI